VILCPADERFYVYVYKNENFIAVTVKISFLKACIYFATERVEISLLQENTIHPYKREKIWVETFTVLEGVFYLSKK